MIEFVNVYKSFSDKPVLENISFNAAEGEICFVLGKSGAGKSVLLKHIIGLIKPDSGHIRVKGFDITELPERELLDIRKQCGLIFQKPALFDSINIFENMAFPLRHHFNLNESEIDDRVERVADLVHINSKHFKKMPGDTSFSIKKRVSIARTIILEPEILLFDEPTTGLDPVMTTIVTDLIRDLSSKLRTTSVAVSHNMNSAISIADHILFIDRGEIIEEGTPEEIINSSDPLVMKFMTEVNP